MTTDRPILTAKQYAWITAGFVAFVIYGSLVPLTFQWVPWEKAWEKYVRVFSRPVAVEQRADWLANILLFIPLGFVAMGSRCVDRPGRVLGPILTILPSCTLLSAAVEFTQIWFPPRDTSLNDVVAETLGGVIGIGIWLAAGQRITDYVRQFWSKNATRSWSLQLIPGYLVLLVFIHGMPFDLTLSPSHLKKKYRDGMVLPIPFTVLGDEPLDLVKKAIINATWFLPAGLLIAGLPGWIARGRGAVWRVLGMGIVLAGTIETMQLFVLSRYCDTTDIITGSLAVLVGWSVMRAWHGSTTASHAELPFRLRVALFIAWVAALLFVNWEPFDFSFESGFLEQRWSDLSLVPFADYYAGNYLTSFNEIIQKTLLFVPFGLLLSWNRSASIVVAAAMLFAVLLEAGQFFLRHHHPGISDLLIEPFGAWLGYMAGCRLRALTSGVA